MTKETLGYVELEWTCKQCGSKNSGSLKACASCGAPMTEEDQFELPAQPVLVADQGEAPEAGADVHCPYCGARSPAGSKTCSQCGADLADAMARQAGHVLGAYQAEPVPDVPCTYCGTPNPASARKCKKCGASLAKAPAAAPAAQAAAPGGRNLALIIGGAALVLLCICAVAFFVLGARTTDVQGVVQSVNWERTIEVLEMRPATLEDWQDRIPSDGQRGTCERRLRHTLADPAPGAEKVCGTPYVIDQGSGKGQVAQDCEYRVYDNWCKYTRNEWTVVDKMVARGNDVSARWPDARLNSGQREGNRAEAYKVTFVANDKLYTYTLKDATEFARFAPGSRWALKVNALGGVASVQPAR